MLKQWKYKVLEWFAIQGEEIIVGDFLSGYRGGRATPSRMFIYRPTKRKYDYVDYTGKVKGKELDVCELTCYLEILGYIKFIEAEDGEPKATR